MRHRTVVLAAILAAGLLAPAAPGAFSGHFAGLESFLAAVEGSPPDSSREGRRRTRAASRGLDLLQRPAADLGDDLATARRMAKVLRSGWRGEEKGTLAPPLDGVFAGTLDEFRNAVLQDLGFLASSCGGREPAARDGVLACVERGRLLLEDAGAGTPAERLRALGRARREWEKGSRLLEAAGSPDRTITATVGGAPVAFDEVLVAWSPASGSLALSAVRTGPLGGSLVAMAAGSVTGPGSYPLAVGSLDLQGALPLSTETGTVEILDFDAAAGTLSLRVTFLGASPPGSGLSAEVVLEYAGPFFTGD